MSILDDVRTKFTLPMSRTDKADRRSSVSSVSPRDKESEFLATGLDADLAARIHRMAGRWKYSSEELQDVLDRAAAASAAWLSFVAYDEQRKAAFRASGALIVDKTLRSETVGRYSNRTPKPGLVCDGVKVPPAKGSQR